MTSERVPVEESASPESGSKQASGRRSRAFPFAGIGLVLAILALGWQWYDGRTQLNSLREEVARRVRDGESDSRDARLVARQAAESVREVQAKLAQLELRISETQKQQVALDALYQDLSGTRDEWTLMELEQILTTASQQLQLTGNAAAALTALEWADSRLARTGRPQFQALRKVFSRDIERLKVNAGPDIAALSSMLDKAIASVESIPLAQDRRPLEPLSAEPGADSAGWWARLAAEVIGVFAKLVRVERVEGAEPVLLAPTQAFFLRENLKLRMLGARLALLSRDGVSYRSDLDASRDWLKRYFHTESGAGAETAEILKALRSEKTGLQLPSIAESLAALRGYKSARQRATP